MTNSKIFITRDDSKKLHELIEDAYHAGDRNNPYFKMLLAELERSTIVDSHEIPADVITMHSTALMKDVDTNESMTLTLVFPEEANPFEDKISILAPIGTAMLGFRAGDTFEWDTPDGVRKIHIEQVISQPEADQTKSSQGS